MTTRIEISFQTGTTFSTKDVVDLAEEFTSFISEVDSDTDEKTISVNAYSPKQYEAKCQEDIFKILNDAGFSATISVNPDGISDPYTVELTEMDED